ncbi:prokaryotic phospholipase A2-domain-containing protein [Triangularia verruculosa]|uniref:Prokaryotic phospholipase A2-domain-containing protein n=1 Tax=Triangularia verruculosa TaxID=2587418 RepID=A0AAN6X7P8_9PEZI|nr:prokaryotic phospholipase A2-domain-containing protein [Triangularia verruculosa]
MKVATLLALAGSAIALPASTGVLEQRQSAAATTDELLFSITLPAFTARRNARNPANLDWSSDGCTSSPDNPFGFPFVPACHRHDFGYHNFRAQNRFTVSGKLRIDNQFKTDLYFQCNGSTLSGICRGLADVYYAAVRAFGGDDATPGKRETREDLVKEYEEKLAIYHALVAQAEADGLIPAQA